MRRGWVDPSDGTLPVSAQCALAGVSRSGWYYEPDGPSARDLDDMGAIDRIFTACPMYGSPRIAAQMARDGRPLNHKRVERLMREMGIQALYPKPRTSVAEPLDRRFPYLLKGLAVERPNQVWGTDFTFVRVGGRWMYLIAYLDWFSRYVVDWELCESATAGAAACVLERALASARPEIHNSDQGCQFTAEEYVAVLAAHGVAVSMDGRGRCFDNIFTERLWRTVKYEEVFVRDYSGDAHARSSLADYFRFYNDKRLHSSLDYKTPAEIYLGGH